jgi:hypothetical protein
VVLRLFCLSPCRTGAGGRGDRLDRGAQLHRSGLFVARHRGAQEDGGPFYRLYFDAERHDVYITLMRGWMVTWPSYVGHTIVATGPVDRWRDHSEMILLTPDAIVFLDAPDTPFPTSHLSLQRRPPSRTRRRPCRSPRRRRRATKWSSYAIASARSKRRSSGWRADIRRRHE